MTARADEILGRIRAREEGKAAARDGQKLDANPYPESGDRYWDWLDAWCVERLNQSPPSPGKRSVSQ